MYVNVQSEHSRVNIKCIFTWIPLESIRPSLYLYVTLKQINILLVCVYIIYKL